MFTFYLFNSVLNHIALSSPSTNFSTSTAPFLDFLPPGVWALKLCAVLFLNNETSSLSSPCSAHSRTNLLPYRWVDWHKASKAD